MRPRFRRTLLGTTGAAVVLFGGLTVAGVLFILGLENDLAGSVLRDHPMAIFFLYTRLLVVYLAAGLLSALLFHPLCPGLKAGFATLGLALAGIVHALTSETHLLNGALMTLCATVHDATPSVVRALYRPWLIPAALGGLALLSLWRWTRPLRPRARGVLAAVLLLGATAAFLPATPAAIAPDGPVNVLLLASDSLRADHLSCNGYPRPTTPAIDALAARGTNFANCLVPTASTHESWVSLFTSSEPRENGLRHMFPDRALVRRLERERSFLPAVLRDRGLRTAALGGWCGTTFALIDCGFAEVDVSNAQNHRALIAEAALLNHVPVVPLLDNPVGRLLVPEISAVSFTRGARALTRRAKRTISRLSASGQPFFLTVVYHSTHLPYSAEYGFYGTFTDPAWHGKNRYRIEFGVDDMIQQGFDHGLSEAEQRHIVDLYDGCVREFDAQVEALVAHLRETGLLDRTIVGVWSDHGDDLYEHGVTLGHGVSLFGGDHANRVPAVFAGPGVPARREEALVRSIDLAPTLLRWLGLPAPADFSGVDLSGEVPPLTALLETSYLLYRQPVPDLQPGEEVRPFPALDQATFFDPGFDGNLVLKPEFADLLVRTKCFAVREGSLKLISVPGTAGPILRLFDLDRDPQCRDDLLRTVPHPALPRLLSLLPPEAR
ncbi:MAG: sulfatase-like hydrolase/transferase [Planctomycetes bacterium]|jgi:arylsulfatase A-like enzyme|nr:sulfatase-like hydrolase/transferase [Planctomycetota bacterium]